MLKADICQTITDDIIAQLEQGVAPWVKPWKDDGSNGAPFNPVSKTFYRGVNFVYLSMRGLGRSNAWITYKQAQAIGAFVKKGSKAVPVVFFKTMTVKDRTSGEDKAVPVIKSYSVFNLDDVELGDSKLVRDDGEDETPKPVISRLTAPEQVLADSGADIRHSGNRAFYVPSQDFIQLPNIEQFKTVPDYYATALHELTHWTGHESRMKRDFSGRFGDSSYAFEELVAELGAAMLCAHSGIDGKLQHASYIENWLQVLKNDKRAIITAASHAQKACDFILKQGQHVEAEDIAEAA